MPDTLIRLPVPLKGSGVHYLETAQSYLIAPSGSGMILIPCPENASLIVSGSVTFRSAAPERGGSIRLHTYAAHGRFNGPPVEDILKFDAYGDGDILLTSLLYDDVPALLFDNPTSDNVQVSVALVVLLSYAVLGV